MIELDFSKINGHLLPAVVQDCETNEVLMVAFMDQEAWEHTLETGKGTYWSRSRQTKWVKGETSGHTQEVKEILVDCDNDTVVLKIKQAGGIACHTGKRSCFYRKIENGKLVDIPGQ